MLLSVDELRYSSSAHILQKSRSHLKILDARIVSWSKFCTEDPQILGTTIQSLVVMATWCPEFMHPCIKVVLCTFISKLWIYCTEHKGKGKPWQDMEVSGQLPASSALPPREMVPVTHCTQDHRTGLDVLQKRTISCLWWESKHNYLVIQTMF